MKIVKRTVGVLMLLVPLSIFVGWVIYRSNTDAFLHSLSVIGILFGTFIWLLIAIILIKKGG